MQPDMTFSTGTRKILILCCIVLCSFMCVSCISLPSETEKEERNLAADYYDIALKYLDTKQYDKALSCFDKARELAAPADYPKIDYQKARTLAFSNKWDESANLFESLLTLDPENSNIKESYAYTLYKAGYKEKALQLYAELGITDPFVKDESDQDAIGS